MPGELNPEKSKIVYAEYDLVRDAIADLRKELAQKEGREISEAEMLRVITKDYAVKRVGAAKAKRIAKLDPLTVYAGGKAGRQWRQRPAAKARKVA